MRGEPGQHMVRVLPHRLGDDQRRVGRNLAEDGHAFALAGDEAVAGAGLLVVGADDLVAGLGDGSAERLLHFLLGRPALLVGREPQVAAGDEIDFLTVHRWRMLVCHGALSFGNP